MTEFVIHVGGMATGKSQALLSACDYWCDTHELAVLTGGRDPCIKSRASRRSIAAARVNSWLSVADVLESSSIGHGQVAVIVDEISLFQEDADSRRMQLRRIHTLLRRYNGVLVAAGLLTTTEFHPFMSTVEALGYATSIVHHGDARCATCGAAATHAVCKVAKSEAILEGHELYEPRCLIHMADNPNLPEPPASVFLTRSIPRPPAAH